MTPQPHHQSAHHHLVVVLVDDHRAARQALASLLEEGAVPVWGQAPAHVIREALVDWVLVSPPPPPNKAACGRQPTG